MASDTVCGREKRGEGGKNRKGRKIERNQEEQKQTGMIRDNVKTLVGIGG